MQSVNQADLQELTTMLSEGTLRVVVGRQLEGMSELPDALSAHRAARVEGKTVVMFDVEAEKMRRE